MNGNGNGSPVVTASTAVANGLHPGQQPIVWEIDLASVQRSELARLAELLSTTTGDSELRMHLRDISGQLRRVKVDSRFHLSREEAGRLQDEFPFINPVG